MSPGSNIPIQKIDCNDPLFINEITTFRFKCWYLWLSKKICVDLKTHGINSTFYKRQHIQMALHLMILVTLSIGRLHLSSWQRTCQIIELLAIFYGHMRGNSRQNNVQSWWDAIFGWIFSMYSKVWNRIFNWYHNNPSWYMSDSIPNHAWIWEPVAWMPY